MGLGLLDSLELKEVDDDELIYFGLAGGYPGLPRGEVSSALVTPADPIIMGFLAGVLLDKGIMAGVVLDKEFMAEVVLGKEIMAGVVLGKEIMAWVVLGKVSMAGVTGSAKPKFSIIPGH